MARGTHRSLPKYLELSSVNRCYYYKNPSMPTKANLGTDAKGALEVALALNLQFDRERLRRDALCRASDHITGVQFAAAFTAFVDKYIDDYRLKASTAARLRQRRDRLNQRLDRHMLSLVDTQVLREAIADCSHFEQSKMKTLLFRFFSYAISSGAYPGMLPNPVRDLYIDPNPPKRRTRMTLPQLQAIYGASPQWLRWLLILGLHLALRRVDLVNLRFDDVVGDRIISPIRKTDTDARAIESTSVDFPIHRDIRRALAEARESSLRNGRCPYIIHRAPDRRTKRAANALEAGRMDHPAQVLPQYASKAFARARDAAAEATDLFIGMSPGEMPTLHELRALSSHLYARAGYDVDAVQDLMAHTDPDMTRAYQKGHARKVVRVEMVLPLGILEGEGEVREPHPQYMAA